MSQPIVAIAITCKQVVVQRKVINKVPIKFNLMWPFFLTFLPTMHCLGVILIASDLLIFLKLNFFIFWTLFISVRIFWALRIRIRIRRFCGSGCRSFNWCFQWISGEILSHLAFWKSKIRPTVQKLQRFFQKKKNFLAKNRQKNCQKVTIFC